MELVTLEIKDIFLQNVPLEVNNEIYFQIRLPLKEKILPNTPVVKPEVAKTEVKEEDDAKTEAKSNENNILTISQLNLENSKKEPVTTETDEKTEEGMQLVVIIIPNLSYPRYFYIFQILH